MLYSTQAHILLNIYSSELTFLLYTRWWSIDRVPCIAKLEALDDEWSHLLIIDETFSLSLSLSFTHNSAGWRKKEKKLNKTKLNNNTKEEHMNMSHLTLYWWWWLGYIYDYTCPKNPRLNVLQKVYFYMQLGNIDWLKAVCCCFSCFECSYYISACVGGLVKKIDR
jgi:hypothetical protein